MARSHDPLNAACVEMRLRPRNSRRAPRCSRGSFREEELSGTATPPPHPILTCSPHRCRGCKTPATGESKDRASRECPLSTVELNRACTVATRGDVRTSARCSSRLSSPRPGRELASPWRRPSSARSIAIDLGTATEVYLPPVCSVEQDGSLRRGPETSTWKITELKTHAQRCLCPKPTKGAPRMLRLDFDVGQPRLRS